MSRTKTTRVIRSSATAGQRRADSQQLVRQWALVRLLAHATEPYSVKQLADQLTTSKATIVRDLATLELSFGLVEETVGKQKKRYRIAREIRELEAISFGTAELLSIYAAQSAIAGMAGTPLHADLQSVMTKIRGYLSPHHNGGLDALSRVFSPHARGHVDYERQHDQIDDISDAIARRRVCTMTYQTPGKAPREHRVRPLRLVWHRSALYLLACLGDHQRISTLAFHRVRQLEVSTAQFPAPRLDVDAHIAKAFGIFVSDQEEDVEIVFDDEIAWSIEERTFHPEEKKVRRKDKSLVYRLRSSAQWEIIPWVQSFGAHAELVAPVSWRAALRANVEAMMTLYDE